MHTFAAARTSTRAVTSSVPPETMKEEAAPGRIKQRS